MGLRVEEYFRHARGHLIPPASGAVFNFSLLLALCFASSVIDEGCRDRPTRKFPRKGRGRLLARPLKRRPW